MDACLVYTSFLCFSFSPKIDRPKQLYLYPNGKKSIANSKEWYSKKVLGIHAIEGILKKMTDDAGFVGNFTCHSLRATLASRMYEQRLDDQLIQEQTGHTSSAVRNYRRTSDTLKRKVSSAVQSDVSKGVEGGVSDKSLKSKEKKPKLDSEVQPKKEGRHIDVNYDRGNEIVNIRIEF